MLDSHLQQRAKARLGSTLRGKWVLDALVGVGGMAAVYRATHRNGAIVAVKMLHRNLSDNEELRRRFVGEGYAANRIHHPAVVRVHDDDTDEDGTPFLVMDFVEGQTLADKIQDRRFHDDELLDVSEQVCAALDAAHAAGVVHRDLKPDNLLVDPSGKIRVLDFGIARLLEDDQESFFSTKTGIAFGTPGFISPEQALGHKNKVGPRTDLFALGATLFYLATGEFLHAAETPQELLVLVATQPARLLRVVAPHLSPEVTDLVDRATRMSLAARWQSAAAMLEATRAIQDARRKVDLELATAESAPPVLPPAPSSPVISIPEPLVETRAQEPIAFTPSLIDIATRPSISRRVERKRRSVLAVGGALALVVGAISFASATKAPEAQAASKKIELPGYAVAEVPAEPTAVVDEAPHPPVTNAVEVQMAPPVNKPKQSSAAPKATSGAKKTKADPARIIEALLAGSKQPHPKLGY